MVFSWSHKIENIKKIAVEDEKLIFTCDNRDTHTIIPGTWENTEVTPKGFKDVKETIVKYCQKITNQENEGPFTIGTFSEPEPEPNTKTKPEPEPEPVVKKKWGWLP